MRMVPKAKPVKIRIKSGGKEHSTLESLKQNFAIQDIIPLLDGRLERWLRQQGCCDLAETISKYDASSLNSEQSVLDFVKSFYGEELQGLEINSLSDLADIWIKSLCRKRSGEQLYLYQINKDLNIAKNVYYNGISLSDYNVNWFDVFSHFDVSNDGETSYILGMLLAEGKWVKSDREMAKKYMAQAASLGYEKAVEYLKRSGKRFEYVDKFKMSSWIGQYYYTSGEKNVTSVIPPTCNVAEMSVVRFVRSCYRLKKFISGHTYYDVLSRSKYLFENDMDSVIDFSKEINFIYGLFSASTQALEYYVKAEDYPPAKYMLSTKHTIDGVNLKQMSDVEKLSFVVNNLFEYE